MILNKLDDRKVLQTMTQSLADQEPTKNWLTALNVVIHNDRNDITVIEAALRIKANLIGDIGKKNFLKEQHEFLLKLIHLHNEK